MLRTACRDDRHEDRLVRDGFVVVDLLDSDELARVRRTVHRLGFGEGDGTGFPVPRSRLRVSLTQGDAALSDRIFDELSPLLRAAADGILREYELLRIAIFDKLPRGGAIPAHQHASIVDESTQRSLTIWLPTSDTSVEMGTLHVVRRSHEFTTGFRPKDRSREPFGRVSRRLLARYGTPISLRAGEGIVFDDRLIHWSPPNRSSRQRTALQLELIPREADLVMYYRINDHDLVKYAVDRSVYRRLWLNRRDPEQLSHLATLGQPEITYGNREFASMVHASSRGEATRPEALFSRVVGRIRDRIGF